MRLKRLVILASFIGAATYRPLPISAQPRISYTINDAWKFVPEGLAYAQDTRREDMPGVVVSLPHTWNAADVFDDDRTYKRGICWYRRELKLDARFKGRQVFLCFEGAAQVADVYVNGAFVTRHEGSYTAFTADITSELAWQGDQSVNTIAVQVNNAHDPFIPPLSIGYASYGGIYRDVWLIAVDPLHFDGVNTNASGVFISTPSVSNEKADVLIRTAVTNNSDRRRSFRFVNTIYDQDGKQVTVSSSDRVAGPHTNLKLEQTASVNAPRLWSPEAPNLYRIESRIEENGLATDEVSGELGFRWFRFSPDSGFSLNGRKLVLHGTTRHQDMMGKGDALTAEDHERDMRMIRDMGANFVRLAHYPQAPEVLRLADRLGLLIWEEVPVVNYMTLDPRFLHNAQQMIREMITQGYNHPSVILWGSMNEILLYSKEGARIQQHTDTAYIAALRKYAVQLDSTVRAEDPTRYSTMAMHLSGDYAKFGLDRISQVAGHNIYDGWYSGSVNDFGKDLDDIHRSEPQQLVFVSEYGAEGEVRLNTERPVRQDYTGQYQRLYHEAYLKQINERPWLAGTSIWNEFDFSQPNIGGPQGHRNQKGLVTWDRKPKDVYYFYKANWSPEPVVHIASHDWLVRAGELGAPSTIDVYSNLDNTTLSVNGDRQPASRVNELHKATWQVHLKPGINRVVASGARSGKPFSDEVLIAYQDYGHDLRTGPFRTLRINAGSDAQYVDADGNAWIEDRDYRPGSFGRIGGHSKFFARGEIIKGTIDQPLYYSFLDSLQGYRADVPDGRYQVTLYFAESQETMGGRRIFDVMINSKVVADALDLAASAGFAQAVSKSFVVDAAGGAGIQLTFSPHRGNALLSGVRIEKE